MAELSFAKSFLNTLESRPSKLSADHVEDPHMYLPRGAYILPKMARLMTKRQKVAPGQERSMTVTLKSLRNPPIEIVLKSQSPLTSVLDLKEHFSHKSSCPMDKIKILHRKKPVGDAKILKDLAGDQDTDVEFSVMIVGGATNIKMDRETTSMLVDSEIQLLETDGFWRDLKEFLTQRLDDQRQRERVFEVFQNAWFRATAT